ncbi:MAG: hypothetical protein PHX60_10990 [Giesbergeria sp.]|uniref:hypothetical protein n=1 Tax=Giesbergeria sp. TaxID=2818473 RepID=UPI002627C518|nr:hypothetical protein [Giesbergeria sp.]MDD2610192.1 hypothetical protein [Giesbergeria sp.]
MNKKLIKSMSVADAITFAIILYGCFLKDWPRAFRWEDVTARSLVDALNANGDIHSLVIEAIFRDKRYTREEAMQQIQIAIDKQAKANIVARDFLENFEPDDQTVDPEEEGHIEWALFHDEGCTDELILYLRENDHDFLGRIYIEATREYEYALYLKMA